MKAKRNMLVCIESPCTFRHTGRAVQGFEIKLGEVSSVTRDGAVKTVSLFPHGTPFHAGREYGARFHLMPDSRFADRAGFIALARRRLDTSPECWAPFADIADVIATARPFLAPST